MRAIAPDKANNADDFGADDRINNTTLLYEQAVRLEAGRSYLVLCMQWQAMVPSSAERSLKYLVWHSLRLLDVTKIHFFQMGVLMPTLHRKFR